MRKILLSLIPTLILIMALSVPVLAGGDQVRGDKAAGPATQVQVQDPPPFQP